MIESKKLAINKIVPYENNPRSNDNAVDDVVESIRQCGYIAPIIVDENNTILAGHTRYKALQRLGFSEIDVVVKENLSDEQKRKYRVLDNKTGELADWDFEKLSVEIDGLDFSDFSFDIDINTPKLNEWFNQDHGGDSHEEGNDEYNAFVDKFKPKKTSDDCFTPPLIFEAVKNWVCARYNINPQLIIRPFYPGGDYINERYPTNSAVIDNPPFSIFSEILDFYIQKDIKFFLFYEANKIVNYLNRPGITAICVGARITYENNAFVRTSFLTNMEGNGVKAMTAPDLRKLILDAMSKNEEGNTQNKYKYPDEVLTSAMICTMSEHGIDYIIKENECHFARAVGDPKTNIFGSGLLISERKAKERIEAEREAKERIEAEREAKNGQQLKTEEGRIVIELTEDEKNIVRHLA